LLLPENKLERKRNRTAIACPKDQPRLPSPKYLIAKDPSTLSCLKYVALRKEKRINDKNCTC
jgi:hypothetical protein